MVSIETEATVTAATGTDTGTGLDPGEAFAGVSLRSREERRFWMRVLLNALPAFAARPSTWASEDAAGAAKVADFAVVELRKRTAECPHTRVDMAGRADVGTCMACGELVARPLQPAPFRLDLDEKRPR